VRVLSRLFHQHVPRGLKMRMDAVKDHDHGKM
jgi:hypothetical protein